jgi:glycosyltransferase involved in cell wall biosynthesis
MVIALPQGLSLGGVTTWGVRLANGLAKRGRAVTLLVHTVEGARPALNASIHRGVRVVRIDDAPAMDRCNADLTPYIPHYRAALADMVARTGAPAVLSPNLVGDCYGVAAAVCTLEPALVRVVGWRHNDLEYDARVLTHYEPIIHRFVGCSDTVAGDLARRMPFRAGSLVSLPYGVETPEVPTEREPLVGRPIRLIYTGRMEHEQKRIGALIRMAACLEARGIDHELTLVGDGPAAPEVDAACRALRRTKRLPALSPAEIDGLLDEADALVLASRYEGLSVSMLEGLSRGCVPIVTNVASGAEQAVEHGVSGLLIDSTGDEVIVGERMAAVVEHLVRICAADGGATMRSMSAAAWRTARDRFGLDRHVSAVERLMDEAATEAPRWWPGDRACAFTSSGGAGAWEATVPREAPRRFREAVRRIAAGRNGAARIALWGAGRHTIALAPEMAAAAAPIVAILEDDPAKRGGALWGLPIIGPEHLASLGVSDVVISSWMHQRAMWSRRGEVEQRGVAVHTLHPDPAGTGARGRRPAGRRATAAA